MNFILKKILRNKNTAFLYHRVMGVHESILNRKKSFFDDFNESKMKLGVSYNVFDGEELLYGSIMSIKKCVEYISVVYQTTSNYGKPCSSDLLKVLDELKAKKLVNDFIEYIPENIDEINSGSSNELKKRNIGLEYSRKNNCTHHMSMDTDEFYKEAEFQYMKEVVAKYGYESAACKHRQYYKDSIYMLDPPEEEYVSTIYKILPKTEFEYKFKKVPVRIDSTRKTNNGKYRVFDRSEVEMHHMSFVRKDIRSKLINSSSRNTIEKKIDEIVDYYNNWEYPQPVMWSRGNLRMVKKINRELFIWL